MLVRFVNARPGPQHFHRFSRTRLMAASLSLLVLASAALAAARPVHAQSIDASVFLPQTRPLTGAMRRIVGQDSAQTWQSAAAQNSAANTTQNTSDPQASTAAAPVQDTARNRIAARNRAAINAAVLRARAGGAACD